MAASEQDKQPIAAVIEQHRRGFATMDWASINSYGLWQSHFGSDRRATKVDPMVTLRSE